VCCGWDLRIIRESPKLEDAARNEDDHGRRPGTSYFVVSENADESPVSLSNNIFSRPTVNVSSNASSLSVPTTSSGHIGSTFQYSESSVIATLLAKVVQSRGGISKLQKCVAIVPVLGAAIHALTQTTSKET
jgi:hypothetical protein